MGFKFSTVSFEIALDREIARLGGKRIVSTHYPNCVGIAEGGPVLYKRDSKYDPYVVHWFNAECGGLHMGGYYSSVVDAWNDYSERVKTANRRARLARHAA